MMTHAEPILEYLLVAQLIIVVPADRNRRSNKQSFGNVLVIRDERYDPWGDESYSEHTLFWIMILRC